MRTVTLLVVMLALCGQGYCQLPEDDEVLSGFPDYPHTFYSGNSPLTQAISMSASQSTSSPSTTSISNLRRTTPKIQSFCGSLEDPAAPASSACFKRTGPSSSLPAPRKSASIPMPGTSVPTWFILNFLLELDSARPPKTNPSTTRQPFTKPWSPSDCSWTAIKI